MIPVKTDKAGFGMSPRTPSTQRKQIVGRQNNTPIPANTRDQRMLSIYTTNRGMYPTYTPYTGMPPTNTQNQRMPPTYTTNQRMLPTYTTNQRMLPTYTQNQRMPPTHTTYQRMPPTYTTNQRMPPTYTTNQRMPPTYTTNQRMPPTYTTTQRMPPTYTTNQRMPPTNTANQRMPPTNTTNQRMPPTNTTNQRMPPTNTANQRMPPTNTTNQRMPPTNTSNQGMPPHLTTISRQGKPPSIPSRKELSVTESNCPSRKSESSSCLNQDMLHPPSQWKEGLEKKQSEESSQWKKSNDEYNPTVLEVTGIREMWEKVNPRFQWGEDEVDEWFQDFLKLRSSRWRPVMIQMTRVTFFLMHPVILMTSVRRRKSHLLSTWYQSDQNWSENVELFSFCLI